MSYLEAFAQRALVICKTTISGADGVDHFFYKGSAFPYFTMRLGDDDLTSTSSDRNLRSYNLIIRYVIGHHGSKYEGENERRLYRDIPALQTAFALAGNGLVTAEHTSPLAELRKNTLTPLRGLSVFPAVAGIDAQQVGTEMTLRGEFYIPVATHH